ncbi:MAG: hypothetical protein RSB36_06705, partial [Hydrogenoanaerobacterium sp.]
MNKTKDIVKKLGLPRIIIVAFLIVLLFTALFQKQNMSTLMSDVLVRFGMNLMLSLAMVPAVMSGTGMNFGLPVGLLCGVLGGLMSIQFGFRGWVGILAALLISLPLGAVAGYLYGKLINAVRGDEIRIALLHQFIRLVDIAGDIATQHFQAAQDIARFLETLFHAA